MNQSERLQVGKVPLAQRGAAILAAMVTVSLVAAVAATAIAQRWTQIDIEQADRTRAQARWILQGALDWARLILRQDAQSARSVDHMAEPWAIPLQPTHIGSFLQAQAGVSTTDASADMAHAYVAGSLQDLQAKLNLYQVVLYPPDSAAYASVERLFVQLGLPRSEYEQLEQGLQAAVKTPVGAQQPLMPQRLEDLRWLGLSAQTVTALQAHAWLYPALTPINLNTASAQVLAAAADMDASQAQAVVAARAQQHFASVQDVAARIEGLQLPEGQFAVRSDYFAAQGMARLDDLGVVMQAQLQRVNTQVRATDVQTQGVLLP